MSRSTASAKVEDPPQGQDRYGNPGMLITVKGYRRGFLRPAVDRAPCQARCHTQEHRTPVFCC